MHTFLERRLGLFDLKLVWRDIFDRISLWQLVNDLAPFDNLRLGLILRYTEFRAAVRTLAELPFQTRRAIEFVSVGTEKDEDFLARFGTRCRFNAAAEFD